MRTFLGWRACRLAGVLTIAQCTVVAGAPAQSSEEISMRVTPDARGCVTEAALRTRIARLQTRAVAVSGLTFVLDASSRPEVMEVLRDDVVIATRRFDALPERCSERLETLALVIALAIEHAVGPVEPETSEPVAAPSVEPQSIAAAVPAPKAEPRAAERPEQAAVEQAAVEQAAVEQAAVEQAAVETDVDQDAAAREPTLRAVVGLGATYGLVPELAGLLTAGVELPGAGLRVGLGALVSTASSSPLAGGTAQAQLAGARAYGCASGTASALDLVACAGLALGVVLGSGRDYMPSQRSAGTLLAPLLRLGARYPARGPVAVGVALDGFVHLVRPELQVSGRAGAAASFPLFSTALAIEGVLVLP